MKKNKKFVTLPIGAKIINKTLADIAWSVESNRNKLDKDDFYEQVLQELGIDAFLHSYTPSGEIGSGDSMLQENPQTPRISESFYDGFDDMIGKRGTISKILRADGANQKKEKNRMFRIKSATVNLIQVFIEAKLGLKTTDKNTEDERAQIKEAKKKGEKFLVTRDRVTDFNFRKRRKDENDEEWLTYLINVEFNRYKRLFVATIFFQTIFSLFEINMKQIISVIADPGLNLTGTKGIKDPNKVFAKLMSAPNRDGFVRNVRELWKIKVEPPEPNIEKTIKEKESKKKVSRKPGQKQIQTSFLDSEE